MSWTAVAERSGDTAFGRAMRMEISTILVRAKSGVALRFPPQSMTRADSRMTFARTVPSNFQTIALKPRI
jgi:hypothetical protein